MCPLLLTMLRNVLLCIWITVSIQFACGQGTGTIKVGQAEKPWPQAQIPNMSINFYVILFLCSEALEKKGLFRLSRPMKHGVIENHQDMTDIWEHMYNHVLNVPSKEYPVLLTEALDNPVRNRAAMAKTFFEAFDAPALFFAPPPVLALYASGRLTGCVLDSGHGITQCVPIYDGFALPHAVSRMEVAGGDVDKYFEYLIRKFSGVTFHTSSELELVRELKEQYCELMDTKNNRNALPSLAGRSLNQRNEEEGNSIEVKLPDGKTLNLGNARFRAPEVLFEPSLIGLEYRGIHYCVLDSIAKADLELRRNLYQQILLSGGSTMTKEFGKRLLAELKLNCGLKNPKFKIFAPVKREKCGSPRKSTMTPEIAFCTKRAFSEKIKEALKVICCLWQSQAQVSFLMNCVL
ncbi:hypothetical protein RFI_00137 [Reticulomyxa filosa]|uniref:Actin n=1 Tax=Reticulomyxa filosa TaxID=46433 RepID=X6PEL9_RETFI|nr:hypothetical protein RFI_00137 [Reticulomyxa filosa]|eukprot:ETO36925.1 hypothetical protein RFI_00137 [Reticulomyxa filosa]